MYTCDRFFMFNNGNGSITARRQAFTPGTAPVAGYEGQYFHRSVVASTGTTSTLNFGQRIENVQTFAGQTTTLSFFAKADAARTVTITATQSFGSGGSADVSTSFGSVSLTTAWQRFTITVALPSIAGKTIGTNNNVTFDFGFPTAASTIDFWGVQLEAGSVATAFQTATGTIQGELAACQRYYFRTQASSLQSPLGTGSAASTTAVLLTANHPVSMRVAPTAIDYNDLLLSDNVSGFTAFTNFTINQANTLASTLYGIGFSGLTQYRLYALRTNSTSGYLGLSAEL
jgi:hypothetical protein